MSKLGIISDIHGNYPALLAVMEVLSKEHCDKILCLGDITGYYSMVNECIALLHKNNVFCLKGNHDSYLLGEGSCPRSHSVMDCIHYQQRIIKPEYLDWLKTLKPVCKRENILAMHGGLDDSLDEYILAFDFAKAARLYPEVQVFLSGHSHIQKVQQHERMVYCNPGAVGQPRDKNKDAAYAILNEGSIRLGRVAYDIDWIAREMEQAGFSDYYYRNLYHGVKIGEA